MKYGEPTEANINELTDSGMQPKDIARLTGTDADDIRAMLKDRQFRPEFDPTPMGDALELSGDWIVVGDVHVPYTDYGFAQLVARVADKTGIHRLLIGGDFFTMDQWSKYQHAVSPATWAQERTAGRVMLGDWLETFTEIVTLQGNHDRRLINWSAASLEEEDVWGMIATSDRLTHSKFGWCSINSCGIPWRVTHPANYGRNQLTVVSDLAQKYQSNIIGFHEHHLSKGVSLYGRYVIINGGCLVDQKKLAYVSLDDSRSAGMKLGFVILRGGVAQVVGKYPYTNWDILLG